MTSATISLPPVTPAFQQAVRELAMQVGYRNACKRIIYGPTQNEPVAPSNGNGRKPDEDRVYAEAERMAGYIIRNKEEQRRAARHRATEASQATRRNGRPSYGLPGPNPSRNKAGGFTCPKPGGYERSGPGMAYSQNVTGWNSDIDHYPKGSVVRTGREALTCPPYVFKAQYDPTLNTEETWHEAEQRERADKQPRRVV